MNGTSVVRSASTSLFLKFSSTDFLYSVWFLLKVTFKKLFGECLARLSPNMTQLVMLTKSNPFITSEMISITLSSLTPCFIAAVLHMIAVTLSTLPKRVNVVSAVNYFKLKMVTVFSILVADGDPGSSTPPNTLMLNASV